MLHSFINTCGRWDMHKVLQIPPTADFMDYSDMSVQTGTNRMAITSQVTRCSYQLEAKCLSPHEVPNWRCVCGHVMTMRHNLRRTAHCGSAVLTLKRSSLPTRVLSTASPWIATAGRCVRLLLEIDLQEQHLLPQIAMWRAWNSSTTFASLWRRTRPSPSSRTSA